MRARAKNCLAAALVAALIALAGCAGAKPAPVTETSATPAPDYGTVVFDMGHGEVFSAEDTTELGQSQAIARIKAAGFTVKVNEDPITDEDLAGAAGLILAGPMTAFGDAEYAAITSFLERGGTVLLTVHVPFPILKVPAHWGLPVGTEIVMSQGKLADPKQRSVFITQQIADDPVTEGVTQLLVVSGWPVATASESAKIVVSTDADAWLSPIGDAATTAPPATKLGAFGIIGVARVGKGRIVVSGDDAIFANLALDQLDNARLLDNIIKAMSQMKEV